MAKNDMNMEMIDTHVHIWDLQRARYAWLEGDVSILNRTYHINELEAARVEAGISKGILVQAANNAEDTAMLLTTAAQTGWIAGVVGWLPLKDPVATEKALTGGYLSNRYFRGVRHLIHNEADPEWLLQGAVIESLTLLADYELPYDVVGVIPAHMETVLKVAEKVPRLRMVLDHLNQPPIAGKERYGRWGELMKAAAGHENIYAKISGLGTASGNFTGWTGQDLQPYIGFILGHFGGDRCFCGGDWPVSLLAGTYVKTWEVYKTILSCLVDEAGLRKIFYGNAALFYGLE